MALEVIRHHRLIEAYLAEALGMPWDRVHDEAEVLEHYISEELEERIAVALGDPSHDPHGDPIPDRELAASGEEGVSLAELEPGESGVFCRVSDSDPEMLRYLDRRGIRPGAELRRPRPRAVRRAAADRGRRRRARARPRARGGDAGHGRGLSRARRRLRPMALADDFQELLDSLPGDWTDIVCDLRLADEDRYIDAAVLLTQVNAQPYSKADWHFRINVAHTFGHAAAAETVTGTLALLDERGDRGRADRPRLPRGPRRGRPDVGPAGVGPARVPRPPLALAAAASSNARSTSGGSATMPSSASQAAQRSSARAVEGDRGTDRVGGGQRVELRPLLGAVELGDRLEQVLERGRRGRPPTAS